MKTQNNLNEKVAKLVSTMAKKAAGTSVTQACYIFYNQPKIPSALLKK